MDSVPSAPSSPIDSRKRSRSSQEDIRSNHDSEKSEQNAVMTRNAQQMKELAEKALEAVHAMVNLESETREELGVEKEIFLCNVEYTLDDALTAIASVRRCAAVILKESK